MNKDEFFAKGKLKSKKVDWFDGQLIVKQLPKSELIEFQAWVRPGGKLDDDRFKNRELKLLQLSVYGVDDPAVRMFDEDEIEALSQMPGAEMDRLCYEVMLINGYMDPIDTDDVLGKSGS